MFEYRRIGTTDVEVTSLGFGSAPLGAVGARLTEEAAATVISGAWDGDVRYFDTAPLYGHGLSERRLGHALCSHERSEFVLSTKVGRLLVPLDEGERYAGMRDDEPFAIRHDYSREATLRSVEESLDRLGLDRIDILLCHDIDAWTHGDAQPEVVAAALEGALPTMVELRDQGVVEAIGLGVNEWQICHDILERIPVDCFLLAGRFTLLEQEPLDVFLPACLERDVSIIIGGPYNSGLLTNIERSKATYDYRPASDELWNRSQQLREICNRHGVDIRAAALQYPLRHPAVAAVIPGARALDEVLDNRKLIDAPIPDALWDELESTDLTRGW